MGTAPGKHATPHNGSGKPHERMKICGRTNGSTPTREKTVSTRGSGRVEVVDPRVDSIDPPNPRVDNIDPLGGFLICYAPGARRGIPGHPDTAKTRQGGWYRDNKDGGP